jgi:hypothetical protein
MRKRCKSLNIEGTEPTNEKQPNRKNQKMKKIIRTETSHTVIINGIVAHATTATFEDKTTALIAISSIIYIDGSKYIA